MGLGQLVPDKDNNESLRLLSTMPWIKDLLALLKDLRYGSVTLVVQDGKVIQMEKVEKIRRCSLARVPVMINLNSALFLSEEPGSNHQTRVLFSCELTRQERSITS